MASAVHNDYSLANVPPHRADHYYIGISELPLRGLCSRAMREGRALLAGAARIERTSLENATDSPFRQAIGKLASGDRPDVIGYLGSLFSQYEESAEEWSKLMQTLYQGVLDSLQYIRDNEIEGLTRTYFAHHEETLAAINDQLRITVSINDCPAVPVIGDRIVIDAQTFVVQEKSQDEEQLTLTLGRILI